MTQLRESCARLLRDTQHNPQALDAATQIVLCVITEGSTSQAIPAGNPCKPVTTNGMVASTLNGRPAGLRNDLKIGQIAHLGSVTVNGHKPNSSNARTATPRKSRRRGATPAVDLANMTIEQARKIVKEQNTSGRPSREKARALEILRAAGDPSVPPSRAGLNASVAAKKAAVPVRPVEAGR